MKSKMPRLYRRLASIVPPGLITHIKGELELAGVRADPIEVAGGWMLVYIAYGLVAVVAYAMIPHGLYRPWQLADLIAAFDFFLIGVDIAAITLELSTYYAIRARAQKMEKMLPDYLLLIASNLRAGMTPFTAFVRAARPEFGELSKEVIFAASNLSGTASLNDALDELSKRFDSMILRRVVNFFKKGVRSGGKLASLLVSSAEEIRRIQDLRAELLIATRTYTIFLGFIVIVIMPFLLSISTEFVAMFLKVKAQTTGASVTLARSIPMFSGNILVTPEEMTMLAYFSLIMTSMLVSVLAGVIGSGRALDGIKYAPIFAIASVIMFMISRVMIGNMLGGIA